MLSKAARMLAITHGAAHRVTQTAQETLELVSQLARVRSAPAAK